MIKAVVDIIGDVVNKMRKTYQIDYTSIDPIDNMMIIHSENDLKEHDVIEIYNQDFVVYEPTSEYFKIDPTNLGDGVPDIQYSNGMTVLRNIQGENVDWSGDYQITEYSEKSPYYMFGHPLEIINTLSNMNNGIYTYQKFPLIALFQDFDEIIIEDGKEATLNILIMNKTSSDYKAADRYKFNFKPVLYPLYEEFIRLLKYSHDIETRIFEHTKTDRLYYGKTGLYGNTANIFNDYIDAIEITNLKIKINKNCYE